jgi:hypothetical protein
MNSRYVKFVITLSEPLNDKESQVLDFFWSVVRGTSNLRAPIFSDRGRELVYEGDENVCIAMHSKFESQCWNNGVFKVILKSICDASPRILFTCEVVCKYMEFIQRKAISSQVVQKVDPSELN